MGVLPPQSLKAAGENRTVPCVTTHPLCHNPSLPSKANKRLGSLCSSLCWWPHTKCDSRGRSRLLRPGQSPETQTLAVVCRELQRFGGRDAVLSGGGKGDPARRSPGPGGVMDASASGPQRRVTFASRGRCQLPTALSPAQARCALAHGRAGGRGRCRRSLQLARQVAASVPGSQGGSCLQPLPAGPSREPGRSSLYIKTRAKQQHLLPHTIIICVLGEGPAETPRDMLVSSRLTRHPGLMSSASTAAPSPCAPPASAPRSPARQPASAPHGPSFRSSTETMTNSVIRSERRLCSLAWGGGSKTKGLPAGTQLHATLRLTPSFGPQCRTYMLQVQLRRAGSAPGACSGRAGKDAGVGALLQSPPGHGSPL